MLKKLFLSVLIMVLTCVFSFAQEEKIKEKNEKKAETAAPAGGLFDSANFPALFNNSGGSYLGVQTREITKENFGDFGLREVRGVAVEKVLKDSPAEKAGLRAGDVIVKFNDEIVTSTRKLTRLIAEVAPDHAARIVVLRNETGREETLTATIGKRSVPEFYGGNFKMPDMPKVEIPKEFFEFEKFPLGGRADGAPLVYSFSSSRSIGVGVSTLTAQLGEFFGVENGQGLLVNSVSKDSPADKAGLKAGDVIISVDGQTVKNSFDLIRVINEKKEGGIDLTVIRDKKRRNFQVTPDRKNENIPGFEEPEKIGAGLEILPEIKMPPRI